MARAGPASKVERELAKIDDKAGETIAQEDADAITATLKGLNKANNTIASYGTCLKTLSECADNPLVAMSTTELNESVQSIADNRGWKESTRVMHQSALKALVEYLHGEDAREEIELDPVSRESSLDPRTVLSIEEFHTIRDATKRQRDLAIIDLFGYTGQRLRVIQMLKIKDVDTEEGVYYLPDVDGLKGARKTGRKRPLLGARKSVADWIDMHPTGNPDDYLLTAYGDHSGGVKHGEHLSSSTLRKIPKEAAKRADVDKPANPHAFRHFFVTVAKTQYGIEDSTIKHLIGHGPGSNVMETTYAHLSDDDHIRAAREAVGIDVEEDTSAAPPNCPTCGTPLKPDAERCPTPTCREQFVLGANSEQESRDEAMREGYREADDMETVEKIQLLDDLLDDSEVRDLLNQKMNE